MFIVICSISRVSVYRTIGPLVLMLGLAHELLYQKEQFPYLPYCKQGHSGLIVEHRTESRGPGFDSHSGHHVSLARHINSPKNWFIPRNQLHHPDMTEKLLTGTFLKTSVQRNKQT